MTYDSEVLADSPTIYLKLDETSGTTCADSSGGSNTFTYLTGVSLNNGPCCFDGGKSAGRGTSSGGIANRTTIPAGLVNPAAFTLEAWVNLASASDTGAFINVGTGGNGYGFGVGNGSTWSTAGNKIVGLAGGVAWVTSSASIGTGVRHVVATRNGTAGKFYVAGVQVATATWPASLTNAGTEIGIGGNAATNQISASDLVDNIAIYPTELSAGRIAAHYSAGAPPASTGRFHPRPERSRQSLIRAAHL